MSSPYPDDPYMPHQEPPYEESAYQPPTQELPAYHPSLYQQSAYQQPLYQPSPYQQPFVNGYVIQPVIVRPRANGKAIASMILGICFIPLACRFAFLFPPAMLLAFGVGIPTIILGHVALNEINNSNGMHAGQGMAITGLTLGYILLVLTVISGTVGGIVPLTLP